MALTDFADVEWQGVSLIIAGAIIAVVLSRLIRVVMDIFDAKKMQKEENLQPLLGVVSPNFDKIVEMSKTEAEAKEENVGKRSRKR